VSCESYDGMYFGYDDTRCLCCFPGNDEADENHLANDRVASLAYLGAAVVLKKRGEEITDIMRDLPSWIVNEIDRVVKPQEGK
jgi:hypothetical protein